MLIMMCYLYNAVYRPVDTSKVADYAIYVRNPMDIGTVKAKLERFSYTTFYGFIEDFRLVFKNAQVYNEVNISSDTTGVSKSIFDKALSCENNLDDLVSSSFSVDISDRWGKLEISEGEAYSRQAKHDQIESRLKEETNRYYEQEKAKLRQQDPKFAQDLDAETKRLESERLLREQRLREEDEANQAEGLGAFSSKYDTTYYGVITNSKYISQHKKDPFEKSVAPDSASISDSEDGGHLYFPASTMLLPPMMPLTLPDPLAPIPVTINPGSIITDPKSYDHHNVLEVPADAVAISAPAMEGKDAAEGDSEVGAPIAMIKPTYTRAQELFMKYQRNRLALRQRGWTALVDTPGAVHVQGQSQTKDAIPSVENEGTDKMDVETVDKRDGSHEKRKFELVETSITPGIGRTAPKVTMTFDRRVERKVKVKRA